MQMFEYKCKSCGANLQLDLDNLKGFCGHCGSAVVIESTTLSKLMMEREKTRQIQMQHEHEERMYDKRLEAEHREKRAERIKSLLHSDIGKILLVPVLMIFCFAPMLIYSFISFVESSFTTYVLPYSDEEVFGKKLEVVQDGFLDAEFSNISLDYTTNSYGVLSEGEVAEVTINGRDVFGRGDKYKEKDRPRIVITIYTPDGKLAFPYSNDSVIGQNVRSVVECLENLGFTNVQRVEKRSIASLFGAEASYTVVKMTVDGKEKFKSGARFKPDVSIVLEYYD